MSPSPVRESFLPAKGNANTEVIPGISDIALYESGQEIQVKITALAKGAMVELKLDTTGARAKKNQVIALLKTIISRL